MKSTFLPALLLLAVACSGPGLKRTAELPGGRTPEVGVVDTVYQVINETDRARVGFLHKVSYDSGRVVYWVFGPGHREKLGYLLTNNRAYKYVWEAGRRGPTEEEFPADTMNSNVRRVLGHDKPVILVPIDQERLAREELGDRYAKPKTEAPKKAADNGSGGE